MAMTPDARPSTATPVAIAPRSRCSRASFSRSRIDVRLLHDHGITDHNTPGVDHAYRAFADRRIEVLHIAECETFVLRSVQDREGQRMFAGPLHAGSEPQQFTTFNPIGRDDRNDLRLALGQRAGLVDHNVSTFSIRSALRHRGSECRNARRATP